MSWTVRESNPDGARFSAPVQTSLGKHPVSCTMGAGSYMTTTLLPEKALIYTPLPENVLISTLLTEKALIYTLLPDKAIDRLAIT
jgi:hypothetical protein